MPSAGWPAATAAPHAGFTLVELVVVMVILGTLAAIATPNLFAGISAVDAAGYAEQVRSALRFAQKTAIAQRTMVYVDIGSSPPVFCRMSGAACTGPATCANSGVMEFPGGLYTASSGITLSAGTALCFDSQGALWVAGSDSARAQARKTMVVFDGDGNEATRITIEAGTGYVR